MKFFHVVGTRPNFVKANPVIQGLNDLVGRDSQVIVHTGQHYSESLSSQIMSDLNMPTPDINLAVGSGTHAYQTAGVMTSLEDYLKTQVPGIGIVYGDVNSSLAAALVFSKLGWPLVHIEAGLRSNDMSMPEEINRKVIDAVADLLLVTSEDAVGNLINEGHKPSSIRFVGNTMIDSLFNIRANFEKDSPSDTTDSSTQFVLATFHRPGNVDDPERLAEIVKGVVEISSKVNVVVTLHPRAQESFEKAIDAGAHGIELLGPQSYKQFLTLLSKAKAVVTDSGGVQEESTVFGTPCFTVRSNTERPITVTHGTNRLVEPRDLTHTFEEFLGEIDGPKERKIPPLWDGKAGPRAALEILNFSGTSLKANLRRG